MREGTLSLRPTIADVVNDAQLLKAVDILKEKTSASAYSLASMLSVVKYVLGKPYFPETVFGNKKTVAFEFKGQNYIVEFTCKGPSEVNATPMDVDTRIGNNGLNNHVQHASSLSSSPQVLQPTIADILGDAKTLRLIELLQQKTKESPMKLASLLCIVKAVFDDVGIKDRLFQNKIKFLHGNHGNIMQEYMIEFEDPRRPDDLAFETKNEQNGNNFNISQDSKTNVFKTDVHHHDDDEDMMDELEKDEIVEENPPENELWRTHIPSIVTKRKHNADSPHSEDEQCVQQPISTKRRSTDKHKAPPLSCEAVKRLFTGITKTTLLQRLEESKTLIASIKDSYANIRPSTSPNLNSSPRLNLLCHLLQSPPTSRIDGISSKVFSNLELYKLFTTYNAYKEEVAQNTHLDTLNSPNKRNHTSPSSDPMSPITFPTYSSFIDPTVTLHIKEQTGGKEVGKHRLNCAWRLSILCELLGKGVLLMTKELSGAKLERILVEEFSKLVDFLKNPENHDWVVNIREKMELVGFDEVYAPLAEADIDNSAITGSSQNSMKSNMGMSNGGHVDIPVITFAIDNIAQHSQVIDPRLAMPSEEEIMRHGQQHYTEVDQKGEPIPSMRVPGNGRQLTFVKGANQKY
ncbi:559_t:CDS:2 [Diversispora eburnea]|uniref:559_t:CDS:1 n=1 Tax=Diversispora eburnea TaxID=1213867 RepID=A0A9N9F5T9_9GLOM|nr:559_t:CDS:2 [Diversispora eburnea]